jgi:hypothetical protein
MRRALGQPALDLANAAWAKQLAELRRKYPYSFLGIVRHVYAICPACLTQYKLNTGSASLEIFKSDGT